MSGCDGSELGWLAFQLFAAAVLALLALAALGTVLNAKRPYRERHQGTGWPPFPPPNQGSGGKPPRQQ